MKNNKNALYSLIIMLTSVVHFAVLAQQKNSAQNVPPQDASPKGPNSIVRTIKQDKKGNIWIASWEGIFKYDGKSFTNITRKVSSARFFSILEEQKGHFWFASIGSGVYHYDGKKFKNFTTKDGLINDRVTVIYEDKNGAVWFGSEGGASRYDGKAFQNFKIKEIPPAPQGDSVYVGVGPVLKVTDSVYVGTRKNPKATDSVHVSSYKNLLPVADWIHNDVNAIVEDNTGNFWFGTRGYACVFDGKTFTTVTHNGQPFTNVRSIIKDKKGTIWVAGADGLWYFDGNTFTNVSRNFVGYVYEDKKGNIWTSSQSEDGQWMLSRYDQKALTDKMPTVTEITNQQMLFGILEDNKGNIWFGDFNGVHRYDGKTITDFN